MTGSNVFVSESVTAGHPDKLCDRISDAIVDRFLSQDAAARVDAECAVATGIVFVASHFTANIAPDLVEVARSVIERSGYRGKEFNARDCTVMTTMRDMPGRSRAVADEAALSGDQLEEILPDNPVTVFGFACRESKNLMPMPIYLAHRLARSLDQARESETLPWLLPDGKVQVAVRYEDGSPHSIHSLTISPSAELGGAEEKVIRQALMDAVIAPALEKQSLQLTRDTRVQFSPEGPMTKGGPALHAGLTGRKTAIETYCEYARNSDAALSGKDPTRIDRVGAYAARWTAKNVVGAGLADYCEVLLSYEAGRAQPISVQLRTYGTSALGDDAINRRVVELFDFRPGAILKAFQLRRLAAGASGGYFEHLAAYGQMGREDLDVPWEKLDRVEELMG